MSVETTERTGAERREEADDDLMHTVCCFHELRSMCGAPVYGDLSPEGDYPNDCIVCEDLVDNGWCPMYGVCTEGEQP